MPRPEREAKALHIPEEIPDVPRKLSSDEERVHFLRRNLETLRVRHEETLETLNQLLYTTSDLTDEEQKAMEAQTLEALQTTSSVDRLNSSKKEWKEKAAHMLKHSSFSTIKNITFDDNRGERQWAVAKDTRQGCWKRWVAVCQLVAESKAFEYGLAVIIIFNSVLLGIDLNLSLKDDANVLPIWVEVIFVSIYVAEMFVRQCAMGILGYFCDPWCIFDFFLTVLQLLYSIVLPSLASVIGISVSSVDEIRALMIFRTLRILRLLRALRALQYFRTVWRLVHGLLNSGNAMLSTCLLIVLTLYIGACLGIEMITKDEFLILHEETGPIVRDHFSGLSMTLLTLSRFVSLDSAADIYTPLIMNKPILLVYFGAIMIFVSIALMNLVTATLVEGALLNARHDEELDLLEQKDRLRKALPTLLEVFHTMDTDGDEILTLNEMKAVSTHVLPQEIFEGSPAASMEEIFLALDVSGDGEVTQREFLDGLLSVVMGGVPLQTVQSIKLLYKNEHQLRGLKQDLGLALRWLTRLSARLERRATDAPGFEVSQI